MTDLNTKVRMHSHPCRGTLLTERYLPLCQIFPDSIQLNELSVLNLINASKKPADAALSVGLPSTANLWVSARQALFSCQIKAAQSSPCAGEQSDFELQKRRGAYDSGAGRQMQAVLA